MPKPIKFHLHGDAPARATDHRGDVVEALCERYKPVAQLGTARGVPGVEIQGLHRGDFLRRLPQGVGMNGAASTKLFQCCFRLDLTAEQPPVLEC